MRCGVIIYSMDAQQYSFKVTGITVAEQARKFGAEAYPCYEVDGKTVAIAANELINCFFAN